VRLLLSLVMVASGCSLVVDTDGLDDERTGTDGSTPNDARPGTNDAGDGSLLVGDSSSDANVEDDDAGPSLPRIVGDWPFTEGSGTTVNDVSGRNHHGLIFGTTGTWVADHVDAGGSAYEFKTAADVVSVAPSSDFDRPSNARFSMTAWMRTSQVPDHDMFFAVLIGGNEAFGLEMMNATELTYYDGDRHSAISTVPNVVGPWHHYGVVVDGNQARMYFDGIRVGQGTPDQRPRTARTLLFGGDNDSNRLVGAIDKARFFRVALSDAEMMEEKNR
jgi:Concanavalin A-like lectin/glucanases superfamily